MSWKARLDHLIADGEQATYLESREILEALLEQSPEERWKIILARDPRLERLVTSDYQWLLKITVTPKLTELSEATSYLGEQWKQYAEHLTKTLESSLDQWRKQHLQELFQNKNQKLLVSLRPGLIIFIFVLGFFVLRADSNLKTETPLPLPISEIAPHPQYNNDLRKIFESSHARWNELLEQRSQDLAKTVDSLQKRLQEKWQEHIESQISLWIISLWLIPVAIFIWIGLRIKTTLQKNTPRPAQELANVVESSQAHWDERLERRSEDLLNALENSQIQTQERLEKVLREAAISQERHRELLWRIMALEELGLKLIAGENFRSEFIALRSIWNYSELLDTLEPNAIRGIPGRPLLLVTLEQIYGDILIQREEHKPSHQGLWSFWFLPENNLRDQFDKLEERVAQALREIRRGNWLAGIEILADVKYTPILQWTETTRARLRLEDWYNALRQEAWGQHLGTEAKSKSLASLCFKTCRIPFCKTDKLCLKQLLLRFKKFAE